MNDSTKATPGESSVQLRGRLMSARHLPATEKHPTESAMVDIAVGGTIVRFFHPLCLDALGAPEFTPVRALVDLIPSRDDPRGFRLRLRGLQVARPKADQSVDLTTPLL
jgi:hypothetical protein